MTVVHSVLLPDTLLGSLPAVQCDTRMTDLMMICLSAFELCLQSHVALPCHFRICCPHHCLAKAIWHHKACSCKASVKRRRFFGFGNDSSPSRALFEHPGHHQLGRYSFDTSYFSASFLPFSGFLFVASSSESKLNLTTFCAALSTMKNAHGCIIVRLRRMHTFFSMQARNFCSKGLHFASVYCLLATQFSKAEASMPQTKSVSGGADVPSFSLDISCTHSLISYTTEVASDIDDHSCL